VQLDWLTVSAQIINFLLLVWLLKRFLYQPVIGAMDKREELITSRLNEAERRESEALTCKKSHEAAIAEIANKQESLKEAAIVAANRQHQTLLEEARKVVAKRQEEWQQQVDRAAGVFIHELKLSSIDAIQSVIKRMLDDIANTGLDQQILTAFLELLNNLDSAVLIDISKASDPILVTTAKALDIPGKHRVSTALNGLFGVDKAISYSVSKSLISGIELEAAGHRIGWNLSDYLDEMTAHVSEQLEHSDAFAH